MSHGGPQEGGGQVVEPDQASFDPGEEEDHDLPLVLVAHHAQDVLELVMGGLYPAARTGGPFEGAHL